MARIVLADDDAATRDFAVRALKSDGHQVTGVTEGSEALALLSQSSTDVDLLITDIQMPAMDGLTLAERVAKTRPGLPILLMSGYAVDRDKLSSLGANIVGLVQKPFTLDQIRAQTKVALRAG
jgi:CheY-like chemotaxis protein